VGGQGCIVFVDGARVGPAPLMHHPVSAGTHEIGCLRGQETARRPATVPAGQTILVRF
jgi:hypothetical protein